MDRAFPGGSNGNESACNVGDLGVIPGWGRYPGEGTGNPLQYSYLENSRDRGAWQARVSGVTKSWTWLTNTHIYPYIYTLHIHTKTPLFFSLLWDAEHFVSISQKFLVDGCPHGTTTWSSTLRQGLSKSSGRQQHRITTAEYNSWPTQLLLPWHLYFLSPHSFGQLPALCCQKVKFVNNLYLLLTKISTKWHSICILWSLP